MIYIELYLLGVAIEKEFGPITVKNVGKNYVLIIWTQQSPNLSYAYISSRPKS